MERPFDRVSPGAKVCARTRSAGTLAVDLRTAIPRPLRPARHGGRRDARQLLARGAIPSERRQSLDDRHDMGRERLGIGIGGELARFGIMLDPPA